MGVIDNVKEVADLVKKIGDIELYRKIVELEGEVIELTRQFRAAEERNSQLEEKLKFSGRLTFQAPFYYAEGDKVPYCPRCWEADKVPIHMLQEFTNADETRYDCRKCKNMILIRHRQPTEHYGYADGGPQGWMR